jgi:hypothetical protein
MWRHQACEPLPPHAAAREHAVKRASYSPPAAASREFVVGAPADALEQVQCGPQRCFGVGWELLADYLQYFGNTPGLFALFQKYPGINWH